MIDELIDNYGWVSTIDGYSLSESHPFYVESIFGGVRVIWENNNLDFYEVGRLYEALRFHGLLMGVDWAVYEIKTVEMGGSLSTPPHSPTPHNDTPLVEAAATGGEENEWFVYPENEPMFGVDIRIRTEDGILDGVYDDLCPLDGELWQYTKQKTTCPKCGGVVLSLT